MIMKMISNDVIVIEMIILIILMMNKISMK